MFLVIASEMCTSTDGEAALSRLDRTDGTFPETFGFISHIHLECPHLWSNLGGFLDEPSHSVENVRNVSGLPVGSRGNT